MGSRLAFCLFCSEGKRQLDLTPNFVRVKPMGSRLAFCHMIKKGKKQDLTPSSSGGGSTIQSGFL